MNKYYLCDNILICCKKFTANNEQSIIFIDSRTDGLIFSFTIKANFSKKNIESFLNKKFLKYKHYDNSKKQSRKISTGDALNR